MKISTDIQQKVQAIIAEQNGIILERRDVIHGLWVATVAQQHCLLLGPGGSGKSMAVRDLFGHVLGVVYFETSLDETGDPGDVFGGVDIKALAEKGVQRNVIAGMLPEATHGFLDEVFNANGPTKHSLQPMMNERLYHNGPEVVETPLRSLVGATNVNNCDTDPNLAPFFDRWHLRFTVEYLRQRANQREMVSQGVARLAQRGRGTATSVAGPRTTITLEELDRAHVESLELNVEDDVFDMFMDIREELVSNGIVISDRRMNEGMVAVLANAWIRGHETVRAADLDILAAMWWSLQEHESTARGIVLAIANPSEKIALDLYVELDKLKLELADDTLDEKHRQRIGVEVKRNLQKLLAEANAALTAAAAAGADAHRITDLITRATEYDRQLTMELFGIDPANMVARV